MKDCGARTNSAPFLELGRNAANPLFHPVAVPAGDATNVGIGITPSSVARISVTDDAVHVADPPGVSTNETWLGELDPRDVGAVLAWIFSDENTAH